LKSGEKPLILPEIRILEVAKNNTGLFDEKLCISEAYEYFARSVNFLLKM